MSVTQGLEIPSIDVAMVTITRKDGTELGLTTSNKLDVSVSSETTDASKLIVKGVLLAQKRAKTTVTGNAIKMTDNVFNPQLVKVLQGGTIKYGALTVGTGASGLKVYVKDPTNAATLTIVAPSTASAALSVTVQNTTDVVVNLATSDTSVVTSTAAEVKAAIEASTSASALIYTQLLTTGTGVMTAYAEATIPHVVVGYTPPVVGSTDSGEEFTLNAYSSVYDAAGSIVNYEKCMYPNCTGNPVAFSSEDGSFRTPEYTVNSAPSKGQAPYDIEYVDALPVLS